MTLQWAVIDEPVNFNIGDYGMLALWFGVSLLEPLTYKDTSTGALQVFHNLEDWVRLCEEADVYDVQELSGKFCEVDTDDYQIHLTRMATKVETQAIEHIRAKA